MNIVLEGLDGAGKSTLALGLVKDSGFKIYNFNKDLKYNLFLNVWRTGITDIVTMDFIYRMNLDKILLDRGLPSNFAYNKCYDVSILSLWKTYYRIANFKMIYLYGEGEELEKRQFPRFPGYAEICCDNMVIRNRYKEIMVSMDNKDYVQINTSKNNIEETLRIAKEFINAT